MMTNNEYTESIEYYGEPKVYILEEEDQYEDEEEMSSWYEFDAYQDFTDTTAIYPDEEAVEYLMYGLVSEVGELAGKLKKEIRDKTEFSQEDFVKELGDVLWYVSELASANGVYLSDVAKTNVEKLSSRKERNVIGGSGDDR